MEEKEEIQGGMKAQVNNNLLVVKYWHELNLGHSYMGTLFLYVVLEITHSLS